MTDDTYTRFRKAYWTLVHRVEGLRLQAWEERGLTLPQLRVLFILRAHPGGTTNLLAETLGVTMSTISGLVDKLVRAGLVERGQHPDDRRVVPLYLTHEGQVVAGELRQANRAYLNQVADALGDDLLPLTEALEAVARAAESVPLPRESERLATR